MINAVRTKRKQHIDFDECSKCGQDSLYQINDADDGHFYDCDRVLCETCGDVGYTVADETCYVVFDYEGCDE